MSKSYNIKSDVAASEKSESSGTGSSPVFEESDSFSQCPAVGVNNSYGGHYEALEESSANHVPGVFDELEQVITPSNEPVAFPDPEVFNAYPVEVQRKIMEWTDRDIKARRDDESRRKDEIMRAKLARERARQAIPAAIIILAIVCAAITGVVTKNPIFATVFLVIALAVIIGVFVVDKKPSGKRDPGRFSHCS